MVARFLLLSLLFLAVTDQSMGQGKLRQATDCRKIVIEDSDRHSFADSGPFMVDIDNDGRPDTITPRTYKLNANGKRSGRRLGKAHETHWVAFDAKTSKGHILRSFFKYNYGTDEADYWAYALVPCHIRENRRPVLLFYAGDDTSEESIILKSKGDAFIVHWRKIKSAGL